MIRHGVQLQNVFYSAEIWLSAVWYSWSLTPSCILQHGLWFQAIFYRVDSDSKLYFTMRILTPNRIYVQHMDSDSISYFTMQILTPNRIYVQHGFWLPAVFYNADSDVCTSCFYGVEIWLQAFLTQCGFWLQAGWRNPTPSCILQHAFWLLAGWWSPTPSCILQCRNLTASCTYDTAPSLTPFNTARTCNSLQDESLTILQISRRNCSLSQKMWYRLLIIPMKHHPLLEQFNIYSFSNCILPHSTSLIDSFILANRIIELVRNDC